MIFKAATDARPYPDHGPVTPADRSDVGPRQVRLDQRITTKKTLDRETLLDADPTFCGDLFPHVVRWRGELCPEDGMHPALRTALQHRTVRHDGVLNIGPARTT